MDCRMSCRPLYSLIIALFLSGHTVIGLGAINSISQEEPLLEELNMPETSGHSVDAAPVSFIKEDLSKDAVSSKVPSFSDLLELTTKRGWEQIDRIWRRPPKRAWEIIDQLWDRQPAKGWGGVKNIWRRGKRREEEFFSIPNRNKKDSFLSRQGSNVYPVVIRSDGLLDFYDRRDTIRPLGTFSLSSNEFHSSDQNFSMYKRKLQEILKNLNIQNSLRLNQGNKDGLRAHLLGDQWLSPEVDLEREDQLNNIIDVVAAQSKRGWDETDGMWQCTCCKKKLATRCCNACRILLTYTNESQRQDFETLKTLVCRCCKSTWYKANRCCSFCKMMN